MCFRAYLNIPSTLCSQEGFLTSVIVSNLPDIVCNETPPFSNLFFWFMLLESFFRCIKISIKLAKKLNTCYSNSTFTFAERSNQEVFSKGPEIQLKTIGKQAELALWDEPNIEFQCQCVRSKFLSSYVQLCNLPDIVCNETSPFSSLFFWFKLLESLFLNA